MLGAITYTSDWYMGLYEDRLEYGGFLGLGRTRVPLRGLKARVEPVGKSLSLRNQATLVVSGRDGFVLVRRYKGSRQVVKATEFAELLNAYAKVARN